MKAKGLLSPEEIDKLTDATLLTLERLGPSPVAATARMVVENARNRLLRPVPPPPKS